MVVYNKTYDIPENAIAEDGECVRHGEETVGVALALPLGADISVPVLPALVLYSHFQDLLLDQPHLRPHLGVQDGLPAPAGHHHVTVETKLSAPGCIKVAEICRKEFLRQGLLAAARAVDGGDEVVGVGAVFDPEHTTAEHHGHEDRHDQEDDPVPRHALPQRSEPLLQALVNLAQVVRHPHYN